MESLLEILVNKMIGSEMVDAFDGFNNLLAAVCHLAHSLELLHVGLVFRLLHDHVEDFFDLFVSEGRLEVDQIVLPVRHVHPLLVVELNSSILISDQS